MNRRPLILCLAAGAALSVAGCGKKTPEGESGMSVNPPPPPEQPDEPDLSTPSPPTQPVPPPIAVNPPPPGPPTAPPRPPTDAAIVQKLQTPVADKPDWDSIASPHPEGATNPPSPVLIVTPRGECFKRWEGGMIPTGGDRVEVVSADRATTAITCPPDRAVKVFEEWVAKGKPDPTIPGFPPKDF